MEQRERKERPNTNVKEDLHTKGRAGRLDSIKVKTKIFTVTDEERVADRKQKPVTLINRRIVYL